MEAVRALASVTISSAVAVALGGDMVLAAGLASWAVELGVGAGLGDVAVRPAG